MSLALVGAATAFTPPQMPLVGAEAMRTNGLMMKGPTRKERKAGLNTKVMSGKVVPTGGMPAVKSWYDAGLRLDGSTVAPPAVQEPVIEASVAETPAPAPEPVPAQPRDAMWNPKKLDVSKLPEVVQEQFVSEYLQTAPAYLDGSMIGDNAFDPWALTVLAAPTQATDKYARTAAERNAKMLSMSSAERAEALAWMRESELKHGRLAMLAAAGWPLSELSSSSYLRVAIDNNGRAPSLFNGHLAEFAGPLVLFLGAMAVLEVRHKDKLTDGDLGFDPLGFGGTQRPAGAVPFDGAQGLVDKLPNSGDMDALRLAELKNGRLAMMAITGMSVQEFLYGSPVVDQTPFFFHGLFA